MFSKAQDTLRQGQEAAQKAVSSATGSNKPDFSKWNTEEMLETTLSKGELGHDYADAYVAANKNFHHPTKEDDAAFN
ncbi:hypothetical protein BDV36DRAFT_302868 [Aspergillus pseudocaelatus]|uniref:Uncharacterized protein n=1 Tax=Aspergillus pseudocaelatus TaxID=1825620 RepID=A0ABQ6VZX1_9EURO|nr:hypothetical protein BDV36DRAFT_302868 [Aspergillus pseudocaelatus]